MNATERVGTVVVGGSQAGLTMGYFLSRRGLPFVILEGNERPGEAWRNRWDSLRLFTPRRYSGLAGMRFPGPQHAAPTKDEMADYLDAYAARFDLPIRAGVSVKRIARRHGRFFVSTGDSVLEADNVVVSTGAHQVPFEPAFARDLDPSIRQIHSSAYRNPSQLRPGGVLVVGAGNSGADISIEVARSHPTWLAGRDTGHVPFRIETFKARYLVRGVRFVGHHVLSLRTPIGRKVGPKLVSRGNPLVRVKPKDILAAGIQRVPRVAGAQGGLPLLDDGRVLDVANVIWCTGFRRDFSWIEAPVLDERGEPRHVRGVVPDAPGLYFLGLLFQFSATSEVITGLARDARHVVKHLAARAGDQSRRSRRASTHADQPLEQTTRAQASRVSAS